jgi:alpha-beta hydrolase superfamily lysophospholipase
VTDKTPLSRSVLALTLALAACKEDGGPATAATESSTGAAATDAPTSADASTSSDASTDDPTGDPTGGEGVPGCAGGSFLPVPEDTSLPGPWPVGARTVAVGELTAEVWYPATPGSEAGLEKVRYDIRTGLPDSEQGKVPDADNPWQDCECWRDLPLDTAHGLYPAVVFVHGTAGFRSQSLEQVRHWASRGFVVVAADHPGLWLKDLLGSLCGAGNVPQNLGEDLAALVAAIKAPAGAMEFLAGHVDSERIAMAGHSAGGQAIAGGGGSAQVLIPMAAGGVQAGAALKSTLVLGAQADQVVPYSSQQDGFSGSPAPKRLVGIANAGHLAFSSLCSLKNANGEDFLQIAAKFEVCGAQFAGALFDCDPMYTPDPTGWTIVNFATAAVLESTLRCSDADKQLAELQAKFPEVGEFQEALQ